MSSVYIGIPSYGDPHWKAPVATAVDLPSTGNNIGDARAVENTAVIYLWSGSAWVSTGGSSGTVSSVAFADGSTNPIYTISGSPVTTTGTITETLVSQTKNTIFAGPTTGANTQPAFRTLVAADIPTNTQIASIGFTVDGGGATPTTGLKGFTYVPYGCTINSVTLMADVSGSCVIDIWKVAYGSFPPNSGNSITASATPTLSSQQNSQDTTLTGWTTSISAGDVLAFNVNSASTVTRVNLVLKVTKT